MMNSLKLSILLAGLAAVTTLSCTTLKRYRSDRYAGVDNHLVTIGLTRSEIDPPEKKDNSKTLWELNAQGQAALVNSLNKRNPDNAKFKKALNTVYLKKEGPPADYVNKNLQLVFSIARTKSFPSIGKAADHFSVADRIEQLNFSLAIPDSIPLEFIKWNQYTTQYANFDIGDVSFTKSLSVTAGYGDTTSGFSLSGTASANTTETQHIKFRVLQLSGVLQPKSISIHEEGDREIDLAGNVIANVSLRFKYMPALLFSFDGLTGDDDKWNTLDKVSVSMVKTTVPDLKEALDKINGTLILHYAYRHVTNSHGVKTFYEWNDAVEDYTGSDTVQVKLVNRKEIVPAFYYIGQVGQDNLGINARYRLKLKTAAGQIYLLQFPTAGQAGDFFNWLLNYPAADPTAPIKIGSCNLVYGDGGAADPLTKKFMTDHAGSYSPLPVFSSMP